MLLFLHLDHVHDFGLVFTGRLLDDEERQQLEGADRVLTKGETNLRQLAGELRALTPGHQEAHPKPATEQAVQAGSTEQQ